MSLNPPTDPEEAWLLWAHDQTGGRPDPSSPVGGANTLSRSTLDWNCSLKCAKTQSYSEDRPILMQDKSHAKRIFGLDIVRAMAILLVMLAHTLPGVQRFPVLGKVTYCCAFFGVDLFFVLSGFLIGGIVIRELENDRLNASAGLLTFWKRRWFRTLPNYYLFLLVNVALALWMSTDS